MLKFLVLNHFFENYEILEKNTEKHKNIQVFNFGFGDKNETIDIFLSEDDENFGEGFFSEVGGVSDKKVKCDIKNIKDVLLDLKIEVIDLIKIDTKGAEFDILTSLDEDVLRNVKWMTGELHGYKDFELLSYLQNFGFNIGLRKSINNRLFMFHTIDNQT